MHVRSLLAKAPAVEEELECGAEPTPLEHNCSGKHAAMLALCRARSWPSEGYRTPDHPCQQAMLAEVVAAAEPGPGDVPTAVDGCGVVTFGLPLERMAHAFSRLERLDGGDRVAGAVPAPPHQKHRPTAADTLKKRGHNGWVAKGGAEGLLCAASADGLGVALKVEDGATRAVQSASAAFLVRLGVAGGHRLETSVPLRNSRGDVVGEIVVE